MSSVTQPEVCQICGGYGLVTRDVPVEDPDFGKAFLCICQADKIKARRAESLRKLSNLGAFADKTFATFEVEYSLLSDEQDFMPRAFAPVSGARNLTDEQK